MGLNEFPPLLGEGLMIKALPGLAAAVGSFVRAYGSWLTAALVRLPLAALPLELAGGLGRESPARLPEGRAAVWVLAGEHGERAGSCGAALFWHLATVVIAAWRSTAHTKSVPVCGRKG